MTNRYSSPSVMPPPIAYVRFCLIVVGDREAERLALGHRRRYVLDRQDHGEQEDRADEPEISRPTHSTPRGACRLASIVSSPNVPAVSNP